jgi:Zn finger protein HypA/HybF involved in hydrogenase expression
MHEFQLMRQVVNQVEKVRQGHPGTMLSLIRLEISRHSHLASHTAEEVQNTFLLAAQGTPAQNAMLEIRILPSKGRCGACEHNFECGPEVSACPHCFSEIILWEDQPELVVKGIELLEKLK